MKIVLNSNSSWNLVNFRAGLIRELINQKHQVICIIPNGDNSNFLQNIGASIQRVHLNPVGTNIFGELRYFLELFFILNQIKPEYYLGFTIKPNIYGGLICRILKIKSLLNITGLGSTFLKNNLFTKIIFLSYKVSLGAAHRIFFQNQDDKELFYKLNILSEQKTLIIPGSGVDLKKYSAFYRPTEEIKIYKKKPAFCFLMISRLLLDKGILEFIDAIKILKNENRDFQSIILGEVDQLNSSGVDRSQLNRWISEGWIAHYDFMNDVRPFIYYSDCVVLPSYREGTPKALLEAGAMGKPLIATDVPGCRNVIQNEFNGFLCKPKSGEDLASAMRKMLNLTKNDLVKFGKNSHDKISIEYDETLVHKIYLDALRNEK